MEDKEQSIATFLAITGSDDYGAAFEYLENNEWDAVKASDQFINTHNFRNDNRPSEQTEIQPNVTPAPIGNEANYEHFGGESYDNLDQEPVMDLPNIVRPAPIPQPQNQPESLLGGPMGGFQNISSGIGMSFHNAANRMFGGMNAGISPSYDSAMEDEEAKSTGRIFLEKFRDKNGPTIDLPPFVDDSFDDIVTEAKRLKRAVFIFIHDHKGDS